MNKIIIGTVCSGIGAPEVAIHQLSEENNFQFENVFACDIDKYARTSYLANFHPEKMFTDMTSDEFHSDAKYSYLFIGGIPCQAFSLAGKRLGELDKRGLLFYDFYRYVKEKQPKVFIIENVKGLLSDNKGKTFQNWLLLLGRSVNQHEQMFLHPDSLEYNLHHTVLNSKNFGVPQNRERVFIVGIRKDLPNEFRFPTGFKSEKVLKDILENNVDEKYYLSDKMINGFLNKKGSFGERFSPKNGDDIAGTLTAQYHKMAITANFIKEGFINQNSQSSQVFSSEGLSPSITAGTNGYCNGYINEPIAARQTGRNPENPKSRVSGLPTEQTLEINENPGITNTITTVQKDNLIVEPKILSTNMSGETFENDYVGTLRANASKNYQLVKEDHFRIRRLTPLECWRLQAFPDENFYRAKNIGMSDTQLYKQAGNSMTTTVKKSIIKNLLPILLG